MELTDDAFAQFMLEAESYEPVEEQITRDSVWVTKDRQRVKIKHMHDSHLLNTIRVLRGISPHNTTVQTTDERRRRWINAMANEAYLRGLTLDERTEKETVEKHE